MVDPITLEFSEAEKIIVDQKEIIAKKEKEVRFLKEENDLIHKKEKQLKDKIAEENRQLELKIKQHQALIKEKQIRNSQNQELMEKLKQLYNYEKKKRKFLNQKSLALQETFSTTENFNITVDKFYTKSVKGS